MKPKTQVTHKIIKRDKSQVSPIKQQKETTMQGTQKINIIQKKIKFTNLMYNLLTNLKTEMTWKASSLQRCYYVTIFQ